MRRIAYLFGLMCIIEVACQKAFTTPTVAGPAAITMVNAVPNSTFIIPVINTYSPVEDYFYNAEAIYYGSSLEYSPPGGNDTVYVVQDNDTVDINAKTRALIYSGILTLNAGSSYSLFLTGADTSVPDYLFTVDSLPVHAPSDSTFGVRFVNLSSGSSPVSVDISGNANGSEVNNLAYKAITGFRNYPASSSAPSSYVFEFRDAVTGNLLSAASSFKLNGILNGANGNHSANNYRFRNFTIALVGQPNGVGSNIQTTILINNY